MRGRATGEPSEGSKFEDRGFRNPELRTLDRAFLACPALHALRCVALAGFFRILLDVVARLDRDGQAGKTEDCYVKKPALLGGQDLEITLDVVR